MPRAFPVNEGGHLEGFNIVSFFPSEQYFCSNCKNLDICDSHINPLAQKLILNDWDVIENRMLELQMVCEDLAFFHLPELVQTPHFLIIVIGIMAF